MDAAKEGKSLDSLTDQHVESEGADEGTASSALSNLNSTTNTDADTAKAEYESKLSAVKINKDDVSLIVEEMEVDTAFAERALRIAGVSGGGVKEALRSIVCRP